MLDPLGAATASAKAGNPQAVGAAMARARQLAGEFDERNPLNKAFAVAIVAAAMAEAGDVPGALAWAAGLEGHPLVKVGALIGIAAGQLQPLHSLGDVPQAALKRLFPRP